MNHRLGVLLLACIFVFLAGNTVCMAQTVIGVTPPIRTNAFTNSYWPVKADTSVNLSPEKADMASLDTVLSFRMGKGIPLVNVWGRGMENPGVYVPGYMPSMFSRTLHLNDFRPEDGIFEWILTGDHGGVTLQLDGHTLTVVQRYFDSFGFNDYKDSSRLITGRHPEKTFLETHTAYTGVLQSITLSFTHDLMLRVSLNGQLICREACVLDLNREQLRYGGRQGSVAGTLYAPKAAEISLEVDTAETHQTMLGFGGSASIPAYHRLSEEGKLAWWQLLKDYNLLIQREYPINFRLKPDYSNWDDPRDAAPHYYGDNFPNGETSDFDYLRQIRQLGGEVVFEFWVLPPWATRPGTGLPIYDRYVDAMLQYCKTSVDRTGLPPDIVGIQNEITQPDTVWHQMTLRLRRALDENGFRQVRIHMHNAPNLRMGTAAAHAFRENPAVWNDIDYTAANLYDYQYTIFNPDAYDTVIDRFNAATSGKPFISTEMCMNIPVLQAGSYRLAFSMGDLYFKNLTRLDAIALWYCWVLLDNAQPSYSASRSLCKVDFENGNMPVASSFQLRVFGSFSRHILKGMRRVGIRSPDPDLLTVAFEGMGHHTVVCQNQGTTPRLIRLLWPGLRFTQMEITDPHQANKRMEIPGQLVVAPGSIITFFD